MTTATQISCPETQWNILVYFLKFGSSILHKCKKRLIGHMANNKYSITCVHQSVFSHLKNDRCSSENGQLCPFSTPCQIITPLVEIAIWLPNPNPTPNPNPSPTPNPKPTNTRGVIIWQGSELGTTKLEKSLKTLWWHSVFPIDCKKSFFSSCRFGCYEVEYPQ